MDFANWNVEQWETKQDELSNFLDTTSDWTLIPTVIEKHSLKDGSLVRFQGMVQDVLNPEYIYSKYNVKNIATDEIETRCGRYKDILKCSDSEEIVVDENASHDVRNVLFCIPIPGMNQWAKRLTAESENTLNRESCGTKRSLDEDNEMEVEDDKSKRAKINIENDRIHSVPYNIEKYFPLPEKGVACIVKHYLEEEILINTRIEVVGFLSVSHALEASWQDSDAEDKEHHPPPSLVPRIHALRIRKLIHCNPYLPLTPGDQGLDFETVRSDLHTVFTQLLFGDTLAADYLIFNLLSTVYARKDSLSLGSCSLNIYNIVNVPNYPKMLYEFLQTLLPASTYLPLTIDCLNTSAFVPRKDYNTNRMWSGRLQLADDTHLLVDETVMAAGNLGEAGLKNVSALHSLSKRQGLSYDFKFYKLDFHTNIPLLILSEGKSMISCDVIVKLLPAEGTISAIVETFEAAKFFMSGPRLEAARKYLTCLRLRDCNMDDTEFVGHEFASLRAEYGNLQHSDIHRLLVLSRILAVSCGKTALTKSEWDRIVVMERERRARSPKNTHA